MLRGRHYTEYVEQVKEFKRAGNLVDALALLEQLMGAAEAEANNDRLVMPPWYAEQAAVAHRKLGDRAAEVAVLRRYVSPTPTQVGTAACTSGCASLKADSDPRERGQRQMRKLHRTGGSQGRRT